MIPKDVQDKIKESQPNCIRLNNLRLGSDGMSTDALFSLSVNSNSMEDEEFGRVNNCSSLEDSLRLVKDSSSYPWLVFGSNSDDQTVGRILEYLCGSLSSGYGKLRIDNGTAVPWSRQFGNIVIEINDSDNVFVSDVQKAAYVNYIISLIRQSEYYNELKDKILFADGMNYEGGTMLSNADCHCSYVTAEGIVQTDESYIDYIDSEFLAANDATPRVTSYGGGNGELISSLSLPSGLEKNRYTAGEYMATLLSKESVFAGMVMADLNISRRLSDYDKLINSDNETLLNCLKVLQPLGFSRRVSLDINKPMNENSAYTLENFESSCSVSMYRYDNTRVIVIANATDSQQQFLVDWINVSNEGAVSERYNTEGRLLQTEKIRDKNPRYTLQAGQVMTITFTVD